MKFRKRKDLLKMHTLRAESRKIEGDSARRVKNAMLMMHFKFVINTLGKLFFIDSVANDCEAGADSHRLPPYFTEIGQVAGPSCPLGISHVGPARKSYLYDGHVINHLLTELAIFQPR